MAIKSAAEFLQKAPKCKVKKVSIPEFGDGEEVHVRQMPVLEWDRHQVEMNAQLELDKNGKPKLAQINVRAFLLCRTLCDENGKRLFTDQQRMELAGLPAAAIEEAYLAARDFQGINKKDVDELEKNSDSGPSESSPTS